ncbi:MAG: GNAT family N-acetyltransferase [Myxococcota bacterium]
MTSLIASVKAAHARHRRRHTPSGHRFALADAVDFLNPAHWDALTAGASIFLQRPYLRLLEEGGPANMAQRYALIYEGDTPVAAVAAQSVHVDGARLLKGSPSGGAALARKALVAAVQQWQERLLVCGNLLSWGQHGVAMAPGADPTATWSAVAEALYRLRRADRLHGETDFAMVKDIPAAHLEHAGALRTFSYRRVDTDPDMVLRIPPDWRTHEDYLASLNAKYRKGVRQLQRDVEKAGCTVEPLRITAADTDALHGLYLQVHQRAPLRLFTLPEDFQAGLAGAFGEGFRCTVIRQSGRLVGFVTTLRDGDTAVGYHIGFDRALSEEVPLYFRLLQAAVADAVALGCRRLSLGRTALEPKAKLGARPEPLAVWVRHRVPALNLLVRTLLGTLEFDEAPDRNPFKD